MTTTTEPLAPRTTDDFESVYADAGGDPGRVPWARRQPSPALVNWLNAVAPSLVRCGARVAVVGCGLGADARELIRRGYDVTAFDCSHTAIEWARQSDAGHALSYVEADLFQPPPRWRHRFDLVVEVNNLQWLPPDVHGHVVRSLAEIMSPHGHLLVICRGGERAADASAGPPWPLTQAELEHAASLAGLTPRGGVCCFTDDEGVERIRAVFARA